MTVISLKDYAKQKNISYEAVRQQVVRYKDELEGHLIRDGRQQFLDEEAVAFLDAKRLKNPVAIIQQDKDEALEELRQEKENLLIKIAAQADRIAELSDWKAENAVVLAEATHNKLLLEEAEKEKKLLESFIQDAKAEIGALTDEKAVLSSEIQKRDETLAKAEKRAQNVSDELTEARKKIEELENRKWYQLLFRKKGE